MDSVYKTPYFGYSQAQLTALFCTESWKDLSLSEKINACQEIENRYAEENSVAPCKVMHKEVSGACYGWLSDHTIYLNTYLVRDGQFYTSFTDQNGIRQEIKTDVLAPGWNILDTVYHEGTHGVQESTGRMPFTYITPEMDGDLYRIQGIEKEAYNVGQTRTLNAISDYESRIAYHDIGRNDYMATVKNDSFRAALADAMKNYNDPNIEITLENVIHDRENNIVRDNVTESYQSISNLCNSYCVRSSVEISTSEELEPEMQQEENCFDDGMNSLQEDDSVFETFNIPDGMNDYDCKCADRYCDDGYNFIGETGDYDNISICDTNKHIDDGYDFVDNLSVSDSEESEISNSNELSIFD